MATLCVNAYIQDCEETGIIDIPTMKDNLEFLKERPSLIWELLMKLKRTDFIDIETSAYFKHTKEAYHLITFKIKYYREIVDENKEAFVDTWSKDIINLGNYHHNLNTLPQEMRMNDYSGVYDMIENQCSDTNRFGLKNGSYYKHTHKLYHTLCVKHEEKLLAEAQERFDKHFKTNGEKIEAMNLLMTKKNAIPILCLL